MTELPYSPYLVSEYVSATERITQTMYTADQMRDYGRTEYLRAIEQAAKVCESMWGDGGDANDFAQAVRQLKDKTC